MTVADKIIRAKMDYDEVYEAGYAQGQAEGGDDGSVWDYLQNFGNRTEYRYAFCGSGFTHLDPKYPIKPNTADNIMSSAKVVTVNWEKFDLSSVASLYNAFGFCDKLTSIDTDLAVANGTATLLNSVCRECKSLVRVQKITAYPQAVWKNSFDNDTELVDITFAGTIGANGLDMHWSKKMNKASLTGVVNVLSTTTTGLSVTLSLDAVRRAFETAEGANDGNTSDEWKALAATKSNWTISLA